MATVTPNHDIIAARKLVHEKTNTPASIARAAALNLVDLKVGELKVALDQVGTVGDSAADTAIGAFRAAL